MAISKVVSGPVAALDGVKDDMTLMLGGFGLCGIPEHSIAELVRRGVRNLEEVATRLRAALPPRRAP